MGERIGKNKAKYFLILLFVIFFSSPLASATKIYVFDPDSGFFITPQLQDVFKKDTNLTINFFVYNKSNGVLVDNTSASCMVYLADNTGKLINFGNATYTSEGYWDYDILGSNLSEMETYNLGISCTSSTQGGAFVKSFKVNYGGKDLSESQAILYVVLLIVILFSFLMTLFFIDKLPSSNEKDEEGRILSISYLKYLRSSLWFFEWMLFIAIIYLSSNLAFAYLEEQLFAKILFVLFKISLGLTPLIVTLWFIWIIVKMFHDRKFQRMINRGIFPQEL